MRTLIALLMFCSTVNAGEIFTSTQPEKLTDKQKAILDHTKKNRAVEKYNLYEFHPERINETLSLILPDDIKIEIKEYKLEKIKNDNNSQSSILKWNDSKGNMSSLTITDSHSCIGLIYNNNKAYSVGMISKDVIIIARIDQSKLPQD